MKLRFLRVDHYDIIVNLADAVAGLTVEVGDKDRRITKLERKVEWLERNVEWLVGLEMVPPLAGKE